MAPLFHPRGLHHAGRLSLRRHLRRPRARLAGARPLRYPLRELSRALRAWWQALGS